MAYSLKSVFKGASVYSIGQILTKASGFLLIPIFTYYLTPSEYGIVGYMQMILQLFATILMFGFYGAQTRYFYEFKDNAKKIGEYLFSTNIFLMTVLVFICMVITLWGKSIYSLLNIKDIPFYPYVVLTVWTAFLQIMNQMVISFNMAAKKYKRVAALQFLQFASMSIFSIIMIVYFKKGALGRIEGLFYGQLVFFLIFYFNYAKNFTLNFKSEYVKYALAFGVPIVFHLLAGVLHNSADRFILEKFVSMSQLGLYTVGYQLGMVMSILVTAINQAWQPNYFDLMSSDSSDENKKYENRKYFAYWMFIISSICLFGILFTKEILFLLTPSEYHGASGIVQVILAGYFMQGLYYFAASPIFFYKKTKILPFLTGSSALLNIILNLIFIPIYGIYGAAVATLISYFYQALVIYFVGIKYFNPNFEVSKVVAILAFIIVSIYISYFDFSVKIFIIKLAVFCIFCLLTVFLYKNYFAYFTKRIKNV
ncbi:MAG: oligosaccharide flippase family protein [Flexistipes sinusarabici]|uniref:Oligosaccharide flippase family protein n=1 Tax=Flexistipes sinusarabici TaxID=2352 RepID=A0A5D0MP10_FLESI|nr:oligosaccharide flippase family protein [Flexistipes sinusarabici]TYB33018.1 MAG: oligosaccharide flippase family protein [Flexistipes sinusarabici]